MRAACLVILWKNNNLSSANEAGWALINKEAINTDTNNTDTHARIILSFAFAFSNKGPQFSSHRIKTSLENQRSIQKDFMSGEGLDQMEIIEYSTDWDGRPISSDKIEMTATWPL